MIDTWNSIFLSWLIVVSIFIITMFSSFSSVSKLEEILDGCEKVCVEYKEIIKCNKLSDKKNYYVSDDGYLIMLNMTCTGEWVPKDTDCGNNCVRSQVCIGFTLIDNEKTQFCHFSNSTDCISYELRCE